MSWQEELKKELGLDSYSRKVRDIHTEAVVKFLWLKEHHVRDVVAKAEADIGPGKYFGIADEHELRHIIERGDLDPIAWWSEVSGRARAFQHIGLDGRYCPYCAVYFGTIPRCLKCPYGKRHGQCNTEGSDFKSLQWFLLGKPTADWYARTVNGIKALAFLRSSCIY